jgi:alkylhydroperoxidase family enzyme
MTDLKPRLLSQDPALEQAFHDWLDAVYAETILPARLLEICRLRAAFHAQCPHCMYHRFTDPGETGIDEGLVCSLEKPEEAPGLSERERSALRYVDLIAANRHEEIGEPTLAELRSHFSEREIMELGTFLAAVHGQQRIRGALRADMDELPDEYQAGAGQIRFAGTGELHLRQAGQNAHGTAGAAAGESGIETAWERYTATLMTKGSLPRRLKQLVLVRLAIWHGDAPQAAARAAAAGLDKQVVDALRPPYTSSLFSAPEIEALRYADLLCGDHFALSTAVFENPDRSLSAAELSDLGQFLAAHAIQTRVHAAWAAAGLE